MDEVQKLVFSKPAYLFGDAVSAFRFGCAWVYMHFALNKMHKLS